jgi:hypothetical protein
MVIDNEIPPVYKPGKYSERVALFKREDAMGFDNPRLSAIVISIKR